MVAYKGLRFLLRQSQKELKSFCATMLKHYDYEPVEGDGFVYGKGEIPILLVAHLDTVHKKLPEDIYFDSDQGIMWSPDGIGGDDRCGVYLILKILKNYKPYVMFLEDEEIGSVGASKMLKQVKQPDINFIIELDRRGKDDCVFYECDNKEFKKYIESFGFKEKIGSFSDICTICDDWDVASVNLSVGYKNEHTFYETINVNYMNDTYNKVINILNDSNSKYYDFQRKVYPRYKNNWRNCTYYDEYGFINDDGIYISWDDYGAGNCTIPD